MPRDDSNRNGAHFEHMVHDALARSGYVFITAEEKKEFVRTNGTVDIPYDKWFTSQIRIDTNLYGAMYAVDFYLQNKQKWPNGLFIECKYQGAAGSVDEKYVFTVLSLKKLRSPAVLLMAGNGPRRCAIDWIRKQQVKDKFWALNFDEFFEFVRGKL